MAGSPDNATATSRLAGRWQIPLLVLGVVAIAAALPLYLLSGPSFDWEKAYQTLVDQVEQVSDGDYASVAKAARKMLSERITPADQTDRRGLLHLLLGDIRWLSIERTATPTDKQWEGLRDDYARALGYGQPKTADAVAIVSERLAEADAALGHLDKAVRRLRGLVGPGAAALESSRRGAILRRLILLQQGRDNGLRQTLAELTDYIAIDQLDADQYAWGVGLAVDLLMGDGRLIEAGKLIKDQQTRNLSDAHMRRLAYHRARVLSERGLNEQADNVLINLCKSLPDSSPLLVRCRLLRAELIWQDNPSDAADLYGKIITQASGTPVATAARVGLAMAYGRMGLSDRSLAEYESALTSLAAERENPFVDLPRMRRGLAQAYKARMAADDPLRGLRFIEAERTTSDLMPTRPSRADRVDLLGRLASAHRVAAQQAEAATRQTPDTEAGRSLRRGLNQQRLDHLIEAANALVSLADLAAAIDAETHADSLWTAAELLDQAGSRESSIGVLERFVASHSSDERVPEARFRLGQALQAAGRYDDAIAVFEANLQTRDPSSSHIKAVEGLIPMAMCYVAQGEEFFDEAEEILHNLVTGRAEVTPASGLYRQALFALGRLYYTQGKWRSARRTLSEAVQRDSGRIIPEGQSDPKGLRMRYVRATRSTYFIAESYQQSAREGLLSAKNAESESQAQLRRNAHEQLTRADALYRQVIGRVEEMDGTLSPLDATFRRNSYFARGDCMYEAGQYTEALDRFSQAVHKFQHRPEALAGLTAMYNCYQELSRPDDAEACRQRAVELSKHLKASADDESTDAVLDRWDRWWETIGYLNPDVSDEGQS